MVSAIVTEALGASYWKPVQAGFEDGTDTEWVRARISGAQTGETGSADSARTGAAIAGSRLHPELYKLKLPASPHIAAREEGVYIDLDKIALRLALILGQESGRSLPVDGPGGEHPLAVNGPAAERPLVIEGAGGLLVPLNETQFVLDLVRRLDATVLLVSRNYLGSINHSLLTAEVCRAHGLRVAGWIFNDQYLHYEQEIAKWSGLPVIGSIPFREEPGRAFVLEQAEQLRPALLAALAGSR